MKHTQALAHLLIHGSQVLGHADAVGVFPVRLHLFVAQRLWQFGAWRKGHPWQAYIMAVGMELYLNSRILTTHCHALYSCDLRGALAALVHLRDVD